MDEEEFIEKFGMTREEYGQKFGTLEDPNEGKGAPLRQKAVDKVAGTLQNLGYGDQYASYKVATDLLGNPNEARLSESIGVLDFTPVQLPFAIQEGKRALQRGDYVEGAADLGFAGLEMAPAAKLLTTPVKGFLRSLANKFSGPSVDAPVDPSRRSAMTTIAAAPLAVGALSEVPVGRVLEDVLPAPAQDISSVAPVARVANKIPLPENFNPISDLLEVKETIDDIIRLDIEDDIDELDDIDDIIEQQGLSRRTEIAKEESIAGIPEIVVREMREKYGSSDKEIVKVLNKFLDIKKKNAKDLVESVD